MKDYWSNKDEDTAVDKAYPLLIKILALMEEVSETAIDLLDNDLSFGLCLYEAEKEVFDAITACRNYEKKRVAELDAEAAPAKEATP